MAVLKIPQSEQKVRAAGQSGNVDIRLPLSLARQQGAAFSSLGKVYEDIYKEQRDIEDKKEDVSEKISLSDECKKVLSTIKKMGDKCQEILMLASEGMSMQEMQEVTGVKSVGTVLSRLSNCRKELKGLMGS